MSPHSKALIIFLMFCISLSAKAQQQCMPLLGHLKLMALTESELDEFVAIISHCEAKGFPREYCNNEVLTRTQGAITSVSPLRSVTQSATTQEKLDKLKTIKVALEQFISMSQAYSDNVAIVGMNDRATQILTPIEQFIEHYDCRLMRVQEGERNVASGEGRDNSARTPKEVVNQGQNNQEPETTPISGRR